MDYKELIDPELRKSANSFPFNSGIVMVGNLYQDFEWGRTKGPEGMEEKEIVIEGTQNLQVKTTVFSMAGEQADMPALVYVHGGAFAYKAAAYQKKLAMIYAKKAGCKVFFPHYHLAPKYQYPAAYEDVMSVYRYVAEHTQELGVDPSRIGIAGDSAGASIAALVCNRWEEENVPMPCLQMLVYPVTDARMETESMKLYTDTPNWDSRANERMWDYYCGKDSEKRDKASPMWCDLPSALPGTYIETAEFDCLHDEGLAYAGKLKQAGVDVVINETEGTFHGYDAAIDTQIVKQQISKRLSFLRSGYRERG
jgi:acetyl esterase